MDGCLGGPVVGNPGRIEVSSQPDSRRNSSFVSSNALEERPLGSRGAFVGTKNGTLILVIGVVNVSDGGIKDRCLHRHPSSLASTSRPALLHRILSPFGNQCHFVIS